MAPGRRGEKHAMRKLKQSEGDDEISVEDEHVLPARAKHNDDDDDGDQDEQKLTCGIDEKVRPTSPSASHLILTFHAPSLPLSRSRQPFGNFAHSP